MCARVSFMNKYCHYSVSVYLISFLWFCHMWPFDHVASLTCRGLYFGVNTQHSWLTVIKTIQQCCNLATIKLLHLRKKAYEWHNVVASSVYSRTKNTPCMKNSIGLSVFFKFPSVAILSKWIYWSPRPFFLSNTAALSKYSQLILYLGNIAIVKLYCRTHVNSYNANLYPNQIVPMAQNYG